MFVEQLIKCGHEVNPKPHLMLHYSRVTRMVGPLVHMNMLKYERKHQELKSFQTRNFNNLNKMLAEKHQQKLCISEFSCENDVEKGFKKKVVADSKSEKKIWLSPGEIAIQPCLFLSASANSGPS